MADLVTELVSALTADPRLQQFRTPVLRPTDTGTQRVALTDERWRRRTSTVARSATGDLSTLRRGVERRGGHVDQTSTSEPGQQSPRDNTSLGEALEVPEAVSLRWDTEELLRGGQPPSPTQYRTDRSASRGLLFYSPPDVAEPGRQHDDHLVGIHGAHPRVRDAPPPPGGRGRSGEFDFVAGWYQRQREVDTRT